MRRLSQNDSLLPKIILRSRSTSDNSGVPSEPTPASPALWPSTSEDRGGLEQNKAAAQVKGLLASICLGHEESRVWYPTEKSHFRHKRPLREKDIHITTGIPAMPSELLGSWHPPQRLLPGPLAESHCADTGTCWDTFRMEHRISDSFEGHKNVKGRVQDSESTAWALALAPALRHLSPL